MQERALDAERGINMNEKIFGKELKNKEMIFKDSQTIKLLYPYENYWLIKKGLPTVVLDELGSLMFDYVSEEDDKVEIILYKNKETLSYDKRRGSTIRLHAIDSAHKRTISIRFARDIETPVFDTWFNETYKAGTIPVFDR